MTLKERMCATLAKQPNLTSLDIADLTEANPRQVQCEMRELVKRGYVRADKGHYPYRYSLLEPFVSKKPCELTQGKRDAIAYLTQRAVPRPRVAQVVECGLSTVGVYALPAEFVCPAERAISEARSLYLEGKDAA